MSSPTALKVPPLYWCYPPMYWIPSQYWRYPPLYWSYSPLYWTTSTVLKVSLTVFKLSPHVLLLCLSRYWRYPPQYWIPSIVLNTLHSTDVFPQYWCYPLHLLRLSPTVLKLSPTVLSKLCSTETILYSTDLIPPMYWTNSNCNVLKSLHSTELTLDVWGGIWICHSKLNLPQWNWICRSEIEFAAVNFNLPWWILIYRDSCGPP